MIQLVLVYCMIATPDRCIERRQVFERPLTERECLMNAQSVAQEYLAEHPQWRLARWRCEINKPDEDPA